MNGEREGGNAPQQVKCNRRIGVWEQSASGKALEVERKGGKDKYGGWRTSGH